MPSAFPRRAAVALAVLGLAPASLHAQGRSAPDAAGRDTARWARDCRDDAGDDGVRHCEVRDTRLRPAGRSFDVDAAPNGGVSVVGWDGDSALLRAFVQTQAPTDAEARRIAEEIHVSTDGGTIRASGPASRRDRSWSVSFELYLPRRSDVTARSGNGPVSARDVTGRLDLESHNGPVTLSGVGGDVRGSTRNGPVTVELSGTTWEGRGLDAETQNGPVSVTIPDGYAARLETGSLNGPMRVGIPITVQGRIGRRIETTLGAGGPTVRAVTTNGPVTVRGS
jgi:hypothetical protein